MDPPTWEDRIHLVSHSPFVGLRIIPPGFPLPGDLAASFPVPSPCGFPYWLLTTLLPSSGRGKDLQACLLSLGLFPPWTFSPKALALLRLLFPPGSILPPPDASSPIRGTTALLCICCALCPHEMLERFFDNYGFICTASSVTDEGQGCLFPWLPAHHRCVVSRLSFQLWDCVPVLPWSQFPPLWPGDTLTCLRASPGPLDRGCLLLAPSNPGEVSLFILLGKLLTRMVLPQVC